MLADGVDRVTLPSALGTAMIAARVERLPDFERKSIRSRAREQRAAWCDLDH